jgi:hypothetical protein
MALTVAPASLDTEDKRDHEVSLVRLYVLRAVFLIFAIPGFFVRLPELISPDPTARGMIQGMLGGLWVTAMIGVRYPLQMLPSCFSNSCGRRSGCSPLGCRNRWPGQGCREVMTSG